MLSMLASIRAVPVPGRAIRLSAGAALALQTSILVFLLAGSIAPTPLYAVYQAALGVLAGYHDGGVRRLRGGGADGAADARLAV